MAPDGYDGFWNVYSERSKADDVGFVLELIKKIGEEIPAADMEDVTIIGETSYCSKTVVCSIIIVILVNNIIILLVNIIIILVNNIIIVLVNNIIPIIRDK